MNAKTEMYISYLYIYIYVYTNQNILISTTSLFPQYAHSAYFENQTVNEA